VAKTERVEFSIHINGTKDQVWHEITRQDAPQDALWHTVLHLGGSTPGSPYQLRSRSGRTVTAVGEILVFDPPNVFKRTLRFTQTDDPDCIVTFAIADAAGGGVDLTLTVDDLPPNTKTGSAFTSSGGGDWILTTIKQVAEDGKPSMGTRAMYLVWDALGPLGLPKRSRIEHWPMENS